MAGFGREWQLPLCIETFPFSSQKVFKASKSVLIDSLLIEQQLVTSSSCLLLACNHVRSDLYSATLLRLARKARIQTCTVTYLSLFSLCHSSWSHFHACSVKRLCVGGNDAQKNHCLRAFGCKWLCILLSIRQRARVCVWKSAAGGRRAIPPNTPPPFLVDG